MAGRYQAPYTYMGADFHVDETFRNISRRGPFHLLDDCVDLFNYIRFNPYLMQDHEELPLKLAIVQCRLARWGAHAGDEKSFTGYRKKSLLEMQEILRDMVAAFHICYKRSCRESLIIDEDVKRGNEDMKCVRDKLQTATMERLLGADLIDKKPWTIHNTAYLEVLIRECVVSMGELEYHIEYDEQRLKDLTKVEITEFRDKTALCWLRNAARDVDDLMRVVASEEIGRIHSK